MRVNLILVRHGHVEGIDQPQFRGRLQLPLTPTGLQQAEQTGEYLRRIAPRIAHIYSSPLIRCMKTGSIIGTPLGLAPIPHPDLTDVDYGAWQGRLVSEVTQEDPLAVFTFMKTPTQAKFPGGETLPEMAKRVREAITEIVEVNPDKDVVVVGHDSTNRAFLLHALGLPLERYWYLKQSPAAVNRLEYIDGLWTIQSLNETAQLIPARLSSS